MIKELFRNLSGREKTGFWSLSQKTKLSGLFFYLLLLFLPTQLGKHFWPNFSYVYGLRIDYLSPTLYFTDLLIILIIITWFFEERKNLRLNIAKFQFLIIFLLFLLFGIFQSDNQQAGFYGLIKLSEFIFLFSYTAKNFRKLNSGILLLIFITSILFESLLTIVQYINQGSIGGMLYLFGERSFNAQTPGIANASLNGQLFLRPYATFSHPNVLAGYLFVFMALIVIYSKQKLLSYQNIFVFFSLTLGSLALFLTLGRAAVFAWVLFLLFLIAHGFWKKTRINPIKKAKLQNVKNRIIALPILVILIIVFTLPLGNRFFQFNFSDQSILQREVLVKDSILMFQRNPAFGVGLNNFLVKLPILQKQNKEEIYIQPVHNIYLLFLAQTGIIGFIFSLYFLIKIFKAVWGNTNVELQALFLLILFLGFFDHYLLTLQQGQIMLAFIFGLFWTKL